MRLHPWHLLVGAFAAAAIVVVCLALILGLVGYRHNLPTPMVTGVQLPDVAGDGS